MTVGNSYECSDALVCTVIGSWKSNLIGSGDWSISIQFVSEGRSKVVAEREQVCSLGFGFVLLLLLLLLLLWSLSFLTVEFGCCFSSAVQTAPGLDKTCTMVSLM